MIYREIRPTGPASKFVKCFWMLEDPSPSPEVQRILPDGRSELILNFGESFEAEVNGQFVPQPRCFVVGQITGPFLVRPRGPAKTFGIRFHPQGANQFFGLPMQELTDSFASVDEVSARLARELMPLFDARSTEQELAVLGRVAGEVAGTAKGDDRQISFAVSEFESSNGSASISDVARQLGLSVRQFERRFIAAVGVSPKLFCRMRRFQRVLRAMEDPNTNWVDTAIDCGYYDQPHLIRDFQQFAGKAPTALLAEEIQLARQFAR